MSEFKELTFEVKKENFADYLALSQRRVYSFGRSFLAGSIATLVVASCGTWIRFDGLPDGNWKISFAMIAFFLGLISFWAVLCFPPSKYVDDQGSFLGLVKLSTELSGLHWSHEGGIQAFYPWTSIREIGSKRKTLVIFVDKTMGMTIPTSAFKDDNEREEFETILKSKMSP